MQNSDLNNLPEYSFIRLNQVLKILPISKSAWYLGVSTGKFPSPTKLGPRTAVYRLCDIKEILKDLGG